MKLCEYGCGQEAKYQFKNGKWCCSNTTNGCPKNREKKSTSLTGRKRESFSKEWRENISKSLKGKIIITDGHKKAISESKKGVPRSEETKRKLSIAHTGKTLTEEHKRNIGLSGIGRIVSDETKEKLRQLNTGRTLSKEARKKLSNSLKGNIPWNKGTPATESTKRKIGLKTKERMRDPEYSRLFSISNKLTIDMIHKRYPFFSKIEEMRYKPGKEKEREIQVHCKNHKCDNSKEKNGWFTPTKGQIHQRTGVLERDNKDSGYFYCSDSCKQECPLFNKTVEQLIKEDQIKAGYTPELPYTSSEYEIFRTEVLNRQKKELDYNECEVCGTRTKLHIHHEKPQKTHPHMTLDPDNGIILCEECHYGKGHQGECSTGNLSKTICI